MHPNQTRAIASSGGSLIPQRPVTPDRLIEAARSLAEAEIATWLGQASRCEPLAAHCAARARAG